MSLIAERHAVDTLKTLGVPVYFGSAPEPPNDEPTPLPVVIVNRTASDWTAEFCGTDVFLERLTLQVDFYAETAEEARRLADRGRSLIRDLTSERGGFFPALQSETSMYDDLSRAWRVLATWRVADYAPSLA
jgi:hypothetical protein